MSVVVPTYPSSSTNSFTNYRINTKNHSQSTKHMSLTNHLNTNIDDNDHVPYGVVSSMKQRFLEKINESLLLTRHSLLKASNDNLLQIKTNSLPLKQTTRLSRSHENLLTNNYNNTEQLTSYLQPKQNLIIVDTTTTNEQNNSTHRQSYIELHVDEVPKPGTVTTVKNMFERQIRLSRYDCDKLSHSSNGTNSRSSRSRSISPNDMALRQRRIVPSSTSYPDLVISHTPPISVSSASHIESKPINNEQALINTDENIINHIRPKLSSDIENYQPLDFKSRLALFNQRTSEQSHMKNSSIKPIIQQSSEQTIRSVTFYGGTKLNENTKSTAPTISIPPPPPITFLDEQTAVLTDIDLFYVPDVIGGNVKLNKSAIFSGMKKDFRVQFIESVNTYEYPSFNIAMTEFESSDSNEEDDDELERLVNINVKYNTNNNVTEKSLEPKGTLHTFRPTHLDHYELGSQHGSTLSDIYTREKYLSLSENYSLLKQEKTNNIPWSSMSTSTDLLF